MIGPGTGVRVYLACGTTDMRKGIAGLSVLAQDVLRQDPTGGAVFAFRGKRGDRLKLLYWDGQGFRSGSNAQARSMRLMRNPPLGWWAKKAAGKDVKQIPLSTSRSIFGPSEPITALVALMVSNTVRFAFVWRSLSSGCAGA